jgi:hypothetical protein
MPARLRLGLQHWQGTHEGREHLSAPVTPGQVSFEPTDLVRGETMFDERRQRFGIWAQSAVNASKPTRTRLPQSGLDQSFGWGQVLNLSVFHDLAPGACSRPRSPRA